MKKGTNEDLEYIYDLEFKEMNEIITHAWQGRFNWENWRNDLAEAVNSKFQRVFVIQVQQMPVGYIWLNEEVESLWITAIVLDSSWQRRQIGHSVLEYLIKSCETDGKEFIELGVQNNNRKALLFYKSLGFQQFDHLRRANTDLLRLKISENQLEQ
jgi:ribosomal protein S18 acetylase RimI-like enzyme